MPNRSNLPWYRYLPVWIIFGFGVTMSIVAFIVLWNWENRRRDYEFNQRTEGIANTLQQYLDSDLEAIRTIGDFFTAATNIDQSSFERLVQRPLSQHLSIESIIWVPRISDEQRYAYEDRIRQQGDPNFVIKEGNSFNQAVASQGLQNIFRFHILNRSTAMNLF
jgi:adenylate cyclase